MDIILVIIAVILSLIAFFIIQWVAYPFILRYVIDNIVDDLEVASLVNGSSGAVGPNGANSPDTKHGSHGAPGPNSASGLNGNNGNGGGKGPSGKKGIMGNSGSDGSDGSQGIPGYNIIPVKSNIFDPLGKVTYYVNGESLDNHKDTKEAERTSQNLSRKERLETMTDRTLITSADKLFFKNVLDSINPNAIAGGAPNVLDTYDTYNTFLDDVAGEIYSQNTTYKSVVDTQSVILVNAKKELERLRNLRSQDIANFSQTPVILSGRVVVYNNHITAINSFSADTDFTTELNDWKVTIGTTLNNIIKNITFRRLTQNNIYTSASSSVAQKNDAAIHQIKTYNDQINLLKLLKDEFEHLTQSEKKIILDTYEAGGIPTLTIGGATFNDYSGGAVSEKNNILTATLAISNAEISMNTNIDNFIQPYRTAN